MNRRRCDVERTEFFAAAGRRHRYIQTVLTAFEESMESLRGVIAGNPEGQIYSERSKKHISRQMSLLRVALRMGGIVDTQAPQANPIAAARSDPAFQSFLVRAMQENHR